MGVDNAGKDKKTGVEDKVGVGNEVGINDDASMDDVGMADLGMDACVCNGHRHGLRLLKYKVSPYAPS
jgi:hypothetical protein